MREDKTFAIADAKCITTWYLKGTAIIKTAEDTPPECGDTFRLGFKDYTVVAVCGDYSYRSACATIVPKEAEPCA
ncbi:hypothetical protein J2Y39_004469 [Pseudomonas sp. 2957]|jgi:hypothetical protein|uniref:hypothetical protein n=1 Tax=Pseudomonas sp. 2957 TaxID=2817766 RepID=UPI002855A422|nr:hypothetical protein [Pseudomonas sp. 2957]MDR6949844.1 hypothetical protein [Pseudomonas sp. 2957]